MATFDIVAQIWQKPSYKDGACIPLILVKGDMLTVFDVAKFFIHLANETGSYISNLKLQKLVYYAQAWYLALHDTPLFEDDFEAWVHGPVAPMLYTSADEVLSWL